MSNKIIAAVDAKAPLSFVFIGMSVLFMLGMAYLTKASGLIEAVNASGVLLK